MSRIFAPSLRNRVIWSGGLLLLGNAAAWVWAFLAFHDRPLLLGTALLAYTFGLRHAVDADHIAAIDNVTRKVMQEGKRPVTVGFFFSLGHSTIVVIASLIVYAGASLLVNQIDVFKEVGGVIGTSVSAIFLIAIAVFNLVILRKIWRTFQAVRKGQSHLDQRSDALVGEGILSRVFRPLFRLISAPWHMYPVGFLFGLGFDTATEVALLGISAAAASKGLSLAAMAVFPALFTAGMTLIDTADGILMVGAYGWAYLKPIRKLYYNLTITFVSVIIALLIGGIEAVGLLKDKLNLSGGAWDFIGTLNENFGTLGFIIIAVFAFSWLGSLIIYRVKRLHRLESSADVTTE
jgi:nickel/cobalt transporter (NiCoT) family protein